jgi:hypothetical protein
VPSHHPGAAFPPPPAFSAQVRILDNEAATGAVPRVMIEFTNTQTGRRCCLPPRLCLLCWTVATEEALCANGCGMQWLWMRVCKTHAPGACSFLLLLGSRLRCQWRCCRRSLPLVSYVKMLSTGWSGTEFFVRVRWTTASADSNIITASINALVDGLEYMLEHRSNFVERES